LVSSAYGYAGGGVARLIYICPHCGHPTYFCEEKQKMPGETPGNPVDGLPSNVAVLYKEARDCVSVGACTASILASRKLLMNVAVSIGAPEGKRFVEYVSFLFDKGYIPPNGKEWVDHIRKKGNEATHEIALMETDDAKELIVFLEMLLKLVYEFPSRVPKSVT